MSYQGEERMTKIELSGTLQAITYVVGALAVARAMFRSDLIYGLAGTNILWEVPDFKVLRVTSSSYIV